MNWKKVPPILILIIALVIFLTILDYITPMTIFTISTIEILFLSLLGSTFALLIVFLPISHMSSELFSMMGIYHPLSTFNSPFGETFWRKCIKVYCLEIALSVLIFIVLFFFAATIIQFKKPITANDVYYVCFSFIVICPAFLLSFRLLANPVRKPLSFPEPLTSLSWMFYLKNLARKNDDIQKIKVIKERFISLYLGIIATVLITLIFIYAYIVVLYNNAIINTIITFFIPILSVDPFIILKMVVLFLTLLLCTVTIGEYFLDKCEVIDQTYEIIQPSNFDRFNSLLQWGYSYLSKLKRKP